MTIENKEALLTPRDVAARLAVSLDTLARWRAEGRGPAYVKLGGREKSPVRYTQAGMREFLK
jgi:predicted site-specific integrase-resolvase